MKLCKQLISLLLLSVLVLSLGVSASAEGGVSLDVFTDPNFRAVMESFDTEPDGSLSEAELAAVKELDLTGKNISSLAGLENLTELTKLNVSGNPLTALDVSKNTKLEQLFVDVRQITSLDLTGLNELHKAYHKGTKADAAKPYTDDEGNEQTYTYSTYTLTEGEKSLILGVTEQTSVKSDCVWNEGVVNPEPTCTEKGLKTLTCTICGQTATEDVDPLNHDWEEATYTWSEDNKTCTAKRICKNGDHPEEETVTAAVTEAKATCTEAGSTEYKASFTNTAFAEQTKTVPIPALEHDWGEAAYTWSEDNKTCTAQRVCKNDGSHVEAETAEAAETVTKEASCTEEGSKTLKAAFTNSAFAEQTKTLTLPKLDHQFAHGRCKVCDEIDPDFKPTITDETKGMASWGTNYVMYSDAYYKDFQKVLVDGRQLAATNYTVTDKDGLICVTLKGDYVRRLKVGVHKLSLVGETGPGEISVTIASKPKTGDENHIGLWIGILAGSAVCVGAAAFFIIRKSKKDQK